MGILQVQPCSLSLVADAQLLPQARRLSSSSAHRPARHHLIAVVRRAQPLSIVLNRSRRSVALWLKPSFFPPKQTLDDSSLPPPQGGNSLPSSVALSHHRRRPVIHASSLFANHTFFLKLDVSPYLRLLCHTPAAVRHAQAPPSLFRPRAQSLQPTNRNQGFFVLDSAYASATQSELLND
ncbi:hypothetical protein AHAS_Ahas14G0153000 [Arachis hypogaea]